MNFILIIGLTASLIVTVSGNIFAPFGAFTGLSSFLNPFGFRFGSRFGFPFGQPFAPPFSSSDGQSSSSFPFQSASNSPFSSPSPFSPSASNSPFSSSSSSTRDPSFRPSLRPFAFPSFPPLPSFKDLAKQFDSLPSNGVTVTSTSTTSDKNGPGQVVQTIKIEKVASETGPGEEKRFISTFKTSGPVVQSAINQSNSQRNPKVSPAKPIVPPSELTSNGTVSQSTASNRGNSTTGNDKNVNNQLAFNSGTTGSSPSFSINDSITDKSTSSSATQSADSRDEKSGSVTSFGSANSDSTSSSSSKGVMVKKIDSSGRITTQLIA